MINNKIKVLIVEDTLVAQKLLKGIISEDQRFELVGIAENGIQAIDYVMKYKPDVVSMDILMPFMDGVEATKRIMQENPVPVVIVSSFYQSSEVEMAIRVLEAGAVSILPRPFGPGHSKYMQTARHYRNILKSMSEVKVVRRKKENSTDPKQNQIITNQPITKNYNNYNNKDYRILAIGASAGGPQGLSTILSNLPLTLPFPVVIVQHIDNHFADSFVAWLNTTSKLPVFIAKNEEKMLPGHVYLPPGDHHLIVNQNNTISINKDIPLKGLRPSVDKLFQSVAEVYGKNSIAVLLSGMGKDGAIELKNLFDMGAFTIVQDELSSLVFGMPGEAVKLGAVCKVLSPENITKEITNLINI